MGTQKEPLNLRELTKLEQIAKLQGPDIYKSFMILRYTGAHVSTLFNPECNLHEEEDSDGDVIIVWFRPKKKGQVARTSILKHRNIPFDIGKYAAQVQKRKKKNNRQYFYRKIQELGLVAGIKDLSPQSLRHSLAIELLNEGYTQIEVAQILNCSPKTLKWYGRHTTSGIKDRLKKSGW